ncbi:hypothetical protein VMF7928_00144 [Vibrio marisflavi CECT 7928]|uniref:Uncharacterized protein n=1 Tax=Vibrio marisflavi CECT 7928 TaxID=634439 RepID=A0ABN8DWX6_9VIBR|nr:hypothetical protein VMF7928_00144 [Vibrio marisflavi CECT 7928]
MEVSDLKSLMGATYIYVEVDNDLSAFFVEPVI